MGKCKICYNKGSKLKKASKLMPIYELGSGGYAGLINLANSLQDTMSSKYYDPNKGYYQDSNMGKVASASTYGRPDKAAMSNLEYLGNISKGKDIKSNLFKLGANISTGGSSEFFNELLPANKIGIGKWKPYKDMGGSRNEEAKELYDEEQLRLRRIEDENERLADQASLLNNPMYGKGYKTDFLYGAKGGWIQDVTASIKRRGTEGKCTPITKPGCTGRAKALAMTFKEMARNRKKEDGGLIEIAPNVKKVIAGSHESGKDIAVNINGNKVKKNSDNAVAKIEGGEIIAGRKVYSERDGYADIAEQYKDNPKMLNKIFEIQELNKMQPKTAACGTKLKKLQGGSWLGYEPGTALTNPTNSDEEYIARSTTDAQVKAWENYLRSNPKLLYQNTNDIDYLNREYDTILDRGVNTIDTKDVGLKNPILKNVTTKTGKVLGGVSDTDALNYGAIATSLLSGARANKQLQKIGVNKPRLYKPASTLTDVTYEPERGEVRSAVNRNERILESSIASSGTRNIASMANRLEGAKVLSPIYSAERNVETDLRNRNIENAQMIRNLNADKLGAYDEAKRLKTISDVERRNMLSQQTADRMINVSNYLQSKNYQNAYLEIQRALGEGTPSFYRLSDVFQSKDQVQGVFNTPQKRKETYSSLTGEAKNDYAKMMDKFGFTDYK